MSSSSSAHSIAIIGSGPGIGIGVASYFAEKGFSKVALVARNAERLERDDAAAVKKVASKADVRTYPFDCTNHAGIGALMDKIERDIGIPEVIVYNAAHLARSAFGEYTAEELESDLRISVTTLYTLSNWAGPKLGSLVSQAGMKPALLVTSGGLYQNPQAAMFSLACSKAAQHNITMSLNQAFREKGIHVAAVVVNGYVKPDSELFNPRRIAGFYWGLYEGGVGGEKSVWVTAPETEQDYNKRWRERLESGNL